ncbi:hypothetical protein EYD10_10736 [Varanus komodoensis]|nr:hypothetical protein EYD10_10736 [Varanus komodoensis]
MFQGPESDAAKPSSRSDYARNEMVEMLRFKPGDPNPGAADRYQSLACYQRSVQQEVSSGQAFLELHKNFLGDYGEKGSVPCEDYYSLSGGKESGIFEGNKPNPSRQLTNPPGGKTSNIFGSPQPASTTKAHPNKPKDHSNILFDRGDSPQEPRSKATEDQKPRMEGMSEKGELQKENENRALPKESTKEPEPKVDDHEPRLGPRPRSHNKVLNPPGGKSSIAFY